LIGDPTWANHHALLTSAGLTAHRMPYFDVSRGELRFDAMLETLETAAEGTVVLLQGACHNPTGADLSLAQWQAVADVLERRHLVPLVDMAYQGLGNGLDEDAAGLRLLAERLPEVLLAVSCSKNFGLYRERVGAVLVVARSAAVAATQLCPLADARATDVLHAARPWRCDRRHDCRRSDAPRGLAGGAHRDAHARQRLAADAGGCLGRRIRRSPSRGHCPAAGHVSPSSAA
jgi:aspartate/methionine/tyrosine aminotransferase